jgi:hypothetical protein
LTRRENATVQCSAGGDHATFRELNGYRTGVQNAEPGFTALKEKNVLRGVEPGQTDLMSKLLPEVEKLPVHPEG